MVVCGVNAFFQASEDLSFCKLPVDTCTDRYDNLNENNRRRRSALRDDSREEVERSDFESLEAGLVFKRSTDGPGPTDTPVDGGSGAQNICISSFFMVIFALFQ